MEVHLHLCKPPFTFLKQAASLAWSRLPYGLRLGSSSGSLELPNFLKWKFSPSLNSSSRTNAIPMQLLIWNIIRICLNTDLLRAILICEKVSKNVETLNQNRENPKKLPSNFEKARAPRPQTTKTNHINWKLKNNALFRMLTVVLNVLVAALCGFCLWVFLGGCFLRVLFLVFVFFILPYVCISKSFQSHLLPFLVVPYLFQPTCHLNLGFQAFHEPSS